MAVIDGNGTILKATISSTLTPVAQNVTLDGPSAEVVSIATSHLTTGQTDTFRPGTTDPGEISGTCWRDPADTTHVWIEGQLWAPTTVVWNLVFNTSPTKTASFSGFVTKFANTGIERNKNLEAAFSIKLTGPVTIS